MKTILLGLVILAHVAERPDLNDWFMGLHAQNGVPCCSNVDGSTIADVDWDTALVEGKSHYRVRIEGEWIVVTDWQVVDSPNRYGSAIAWIYHSNGKPQIRCFMPGAGG